MSLSTGESTNEPHAAPFDVSLPTQHVYLGNLRDIFNRPHYSVNALIALPFVYVPDVVLMPGQQIPINVDPHDVDLNPLLNDLEDVEHQRKGFVCMAAELDPDLRSVKETHSYFLFGTVASVVRVENPTGIQQPNNDDDDLGAGTRMIVRGCQRCLIKSIITNGPFERRVGLFRILPEEGLDPPLGLVIPNEWRTALGAKKSGCTSAAYLTPHTPAMFATLDLTHLIEELKKELLVLQINPEMGTDATDFSYWLAATLPLPAHFRLQLLGAASTVHRLRSCLMMLRTFDRLDCTGCGVGLAVKADGICMSRSNLTAAYINPGGVTQEIFTMRKVSSNVAVFGSRTSQYTWFPGYAWRHLYCRGCNTHLGWRYDAERPDLVPKSFYGIRRGNVVPSVQPAEGLGPQELQEFFQAQNSVITPVYYTED